MAQYCPDCKRILEDVKLDTAGLWLAPAPISERPPILPPIPVCDWDYTTQIPSRRKVWLDPPVKKKLPAPPIHAVSSSPAIVPYTCRAVDSSVDMTGWVWRIVAAIVLIGVLSGGLYLMWLWICDGLWPWCKDNFVVLLIGGSVLASCIKGAGGLR